MGVIDHRQHRALRGDRPQQREGGRVGGKAIRHRRRPERQRGSQGGLLGLWDLIEPVEQRPQEVGQPGKGKAGLRLDAPRLEHLEAGGGREQVLEQRRLADPGLAAQEQGGAPAVSSTVKGRAQPRPLRLAADEHGAIVLGEPPACRGRDGPDGPIYFGYLVASPLSQQRATQRRWRGSSARSRVRPLVSEDRAEDDQLVAPHDVAGVPLALGVVEQEEIPRSQPPSLAVAHGQLDRAAKD